MKILDKPTPTIWTLISARLCLAVMLTIIVFFLFFAIIPATIILLVCDIIEEMGEKR